MPSFRLPKTYWLLGKTFDIANAVNNAGPCAARSDVDPYIVILIINSPIMMFHPEAERRLSPPNGGCCSLTPEMQFLLVQDAQKSSANLCDTGFNRERLQMQLQDFWRIVNRIGCCVLELEWNSKVRMTYLPP
jgi:hypothetical protein